MSDAVSTTGILVQRGTGTPPAAVAITSSSVANPTVITTAAPHGLQSGDLATIAGHTGSTPTVNGEHLVTKIDATHFSIPVNVTVGGTGGTVQAPDQYETLGELTSVTPPQFSRDKIPTTTHNEGRESNVLGILLQSDAAGRINYVAGNTTHQQLLADIKADTKKNWRILFPPASGLVLTGPARVQRFALADAPVNAAQQADVAWTWAGEIQEGYNPIVV